MVIQKLKLQYARQLLSLSAAAFAKDPSVCIRRVLPAEDDWVLVGHKVVTISSNCPEMSTVHPST